MKNKKIQKKNITTRRSSSYSKTVSPDNWKIFVALILILLISFVAYMPVLNNGLLAWDDNAYIKDNLLVHSINFKDIFSQNVMGNYHPLTILTFAFEYKFFGLNPAGYHSVNLILHLLNTLLVFYAVFLLSEKNGVALVAALLFGVHPLHVESVAWVAELKDLLYTFFFLASWIFYLKYLKDFQKKFIVFALLLFLLSLLSKAMAASLPVVLILTDYFKGRKINLMSLLEKVPFFLMAIIFGIVAIIAQNSSEAIQDISVFTYPQRIVFACYGFISYLLKLVLPLNLSAIYPYPVKSGGNIPNQYYIYLLLFSGLVAIILYSLRYTRKVFFGIGLFTVTIFLVLQLIPVGDAIMADRYSYIPSIGIFYLGGEGIIQLWNKKFKIATILLLSAFSAFFSINTYIRCGIWKNEMTLWNDVINKFQTNAKAYYNRGTILMNEKKENEALNDFNKAITLNQSYSKAYNNRGTILLNKNRFTEALSDFNKAIELNPDYYQAYHNRGNIFTNEKKYDEAIKNYSKSIELKADYSISYYSRGLAKYYDGEKEAACNDMKLAASLGYSPANGFISQICK